jgi:diacylglycerol kinase
MTKDSAQELAVARQSIFKSWSVSLQGFVNAVRTERNVGLVCAFVVLALTLSVLLQISILEWIIVILCCGLVLTTELLNTAIEAVTDLACDEKIHPLAKIAKDTASAATLVASCTSLIIGLLIFIPKLMTLF